jgi:hypothetical protein
MFDDVINGRLQAVNIIAKHAQCGVASATQESTDPARSVVVVNVQQPRRAIEASDRHSCADGTASALRFEQSVVFLACQPVAAQLAS